LDANIVAGEAILSGDLIYEISYAGIQGQPAIFHHPLVRFDWFYLMSKLLPLRFCWITFDYLIFIFNFSFRTFYI